MKPDRRREAAKRRGERERAAGLEPDDAAAKWLEEHDPAPAPQPSRRPAKSRELHRWRRREDGRG